jgi:hypothetical protein
MYIDGTVSQVAICITDTTTPDNNIMARRKSAGGFTFKEMDLKEAKQQFVRSRGRGSIYDPIIEAASKLKAGKALLIEGVSYSNVLGIRKRVADHLGQDYKAESTKTDAEKSLYDVLITKTK